MFSLLSWAAFKLRPFVSSKDVSSRCASLITVCMRLFYFFCTVINSRLELHAPGSVRSFVILRLGALAELADP